MFIIIFTSIILVIMLSLTIINKQVAKFAYKDLYITDIGSVEYNSKVFNKKATIGGVVPKQNNIKFNIKYLKFLIKFKILTNKPLDKLEKMFYESYNFINENILKNTSIFDDVLYINDYCRVIYIADAILKENKYNVKTSDIENFVNSYNIELSYNEVKYLGDAFKYQIAIYINEIVKFILYSNRMKQKAKAKYNSKYDNSVVYLYYYGKYTNNFENFYNNFKNKFNSYDEIVSKYFNIINNKSYKLFSLINTLKSVNISSFNHLYFGYEILDINDYTKVYSFDKKSEILQLNSNLSKSCKIDEKYLLYKVMEYSNIVNTDMYILLSKNDKKLIDYVKNNNAITKDKKKL